MTPVAPLVPDGGVVQAQPDDRPAPAEATMGTAATPAATWVPAPLAEVGLPPVMPTATFRPVPVPPCPPSGAGWVLVVAVPPVAVPMCTDTVPAVTVVDAASDWLLGAVPADTETSVPAEDVVPASRLADVAAVTPVVEPPVPETEICVLVVAVPSVAVLELTETVPAVPACVEVCVTLPAVVFALTWTVPAVPAGVLPWAETAVPVETVPLTEVSGPVLTVVLAPTAMPAVPVVAQPHEVALAGAPDVPVLTDVLRSVVGDVLVPVVGRPSASVICPVRSRDRSPAPPSTITRTAIRTTSRMLGCM